MTQNKMLRSAFGIIGFSLLIVVSTVSRAYAATPGDVGSWTISGNSIPQSRVYSNSVTYNGYIYDIGGYSSGNAHDNVYYAPLNSDGSTGSWTTSPNSLPQGVDDAGAVVNNGYIYVVGGYTNTYSDQIYYAHLNSDGSVGAWTTSGNVLPQGLDDLTVSTSNNYLYAVGGNNGAGEINDVYYAHLNSDGSVGAWTTSGNVLPQGLSAASSLTHNGYIYVMGGIHTGGEIDSVYYAHLNSDGSVGAWTTSGNVMPHNLAFFSLVSYNGYVFAIGGYDGNTQAGVYSAPLNSNGSVGSWTTSPNSLPQALYGAGASVYNGYVYIISGYVGGFPNSTLTSVSYAQLSGYAVPGISNTMDATVVSGSRVTVDVLAGATGNPDPSTLKIVSGPSHGTAFDPPETITYIPTKGYVGPDSLVYQVCSLDDSSVCAEGTLTFNVLAAAPDTGFGSRPSGLASSIASFFAATGLVSLAIGLNRLIKASSASR